MVVITHVALPKQYVKQQPISKKHNLVSGPAALPTPAAAAALTSAEETKTAPVGSEPAKEKTSEWTVVRYKHSVKKNRNWHAHVEEDADCKVQDKHKYEEKKDAAALTKAQSRHLRRQRRRQAKQTSKAASSCASSAAPSELDEKDQDEKDQTELSEKENAAVVPGCKTGSAKPLISKLPYKVLVVEFLSFLAGSDIARFACCSRATRKIAEEGYLWKGVFQARFPLAQLSPASMKDWRLLYLLQLNNIVDKMRCSVTKATFLEDTLGIPIVYTTNPKTRRVDYIHSSMDLLSRTAVKDKKVRTDVWGETFELWLPLFFNDSHFQGALPHIKRCVLNLCPDWKSAHFHPHMVLDALPKLINTFTVLLCDEGLLACKKSFQGFTALHRLFLALAHEFPTIQREADRRLSEFIAKESNRSKEVVPSLGNLLPLLLISDRFSWRDVARAYLAESFDRSVLWICKHNFKMEQVAGPNGQPESPAQEEERLHQSFEASRVSQRLLMFHVHFLRGHCKGTSEDRAHRYDAFLTHPEPSDGIEVREMQDPAAADDEKELLKTEDAAAAPLPANSYDAFCRAVKGILAVETWPSFFAAIGMVCPSKSRLAEWLRQSVRNSGRRLYHKRGMDFGRVHASGVSQILKKGQTYATDQSLTNVVFRDTWYFEGDTKYLDASVLLFAGNKLVEFVDFRKTSARGVVHSGDQMGAQHGVHTIDIDLARLAPHVDTLFFTLSAYSTAKLSDIITPNVSFANEQTGEILCQYDLEQHNKIDALTAVIMCKLSRTSTGAWAVLAIGDSCRGQAGSLDSYEPILKAVKAYL